MEISCVDDNDLDSLHFCQYLHNLWVLAMEFTERYPGAAFYDVGAGGEPEGGGPENVPVGLGPWGPSCGIPVP